jgi:hypothetical protein
MRIDAFLYTCGAGTACYNPFAPCWSNSESAGASQLVALTAALVHRWPMTNLLDIRKETELRVHFSEQFRTVGGRELISSAVLQRRPLLCLYGLGTNSGLNACAAEPTKVTPDLQLICGRYRY